MSSTIRYWLLTLTSKNRTTADLRSLLVDRRLAPRTTQSTIRSWSSTFTLSTISTVLGKSNITSTFRTPTDYITFLWILLMINITFPSGQLRWLHIRGMNYMPRSDHPMVNVRMMGTWPRASARKLGPRSLLWRMICHPYNDSITASLPYEWYAYTRRDGH